MTPETFRAGPNLGQLSNVTVIHGDCIEAMAEIADDSVDAIVTDPPYGLSNTDTKHVVEALTHWVSGDRAFVPHVGGGGFMGKDWDKFVPPPAAWDECFRVLKPGGALLSFAGTRTIGLMEISIRLAGFDIWDSVAWMHGQGFPKGKTQLKPAFEPVICTRKPFRGTIAANVLQHGTGALNIDDCRIEGRPPSVPRGQFSGSNNNWEMSGRNGTMSEPHAAGRWPADVVLDESQAAALDEQSGTLTSGSRKAGTYAGLGYMGSESAKFPEVNGNSGGASRFFLNVPLDEMDARFRYCAKAPKKERPTYVDVDGKQQSHATVKPLALMRWLVRLVTPPGGVVLDPFAGSGTTVEAALQEGFKVIGIEREADYLPMIQQRISRTLTKLKER